MAKQDDGKNKGVKAPKVEPKPRLVKESPESLIAKGYKPVVKDGKTYYEKRESSGKPESSDPVLPPRPKKAVSGKPKKSIPPKPRYDPPANDESVDIVYMEDSEPKEVQTGLYGEASTTRTIDPNKQNLRNYGVTTLSYPDTEGRTGATGRDFFVDSEGREVVYDISDPLKNFVDGKFTPKYTGRTVADLDKEYSLTQYRTPLESGVNKVNPDFKGSLTKPGTVATRMLSGGSGELTEMNQSKAKGGVSGQPQGFILQKYDAQGNPIETPNVGLQTDKTNITPLEVENMETGKMYELPPKKEEVFTIPKFNKGGLVGKIKGYYQGGTPGFDEFNPNVTGYSGAKSKSKEDDGNKINAGKTTQTIGKGLGAFGSSYYAMQQPSTKGDMARNMGMQAVGQMGPIGGIIGGVTSLAEIASAKKKEETQRLNPITGDVEDEDKALRNARIGIAFDPTQRLKYEGGLTDITGKKYLESLNKEYKKDLAAVKEANVKSKQQQALAAREAGEENPSYYTPYNLANARVGKDRRLEFADGTTFDPNMQTAAKGGTIKGPGTGTSDSILSKVSKDGIPAGSFITPAKNNGLAKQIRKKVLGDNPDKVAKFEKGGEMEDDADVAVSNGEHLFTPKEKNKIISYLGKEILEELAPEAEEDSDEMAKGGLTRNKAREILHDKSVHGKPLTDKQRKFMGAVASGYVEGYEKGGSVKAPKVMGYAKGTDADGVDPKKEKAKIQLEEELVKKGLAEKEAKSEEAKKVRIKEETKKKLIEDRKSKELKLAQELKDASTELNALEKAYKDYSEASSKPMTETEKKIGGQMEKDPSIIRARKKELLDKLEAARSKADKVKKDYDFVRDDKNYVDGYYPKDLVKGGVDKATTEGTKAVAETEAKPTETKTAGATETTKTTGGVKAPKFGTAKKPTSDVPESARFTPPVAVESVTDEVVVPMSDSERAKVTRKEAADKAQADLLNASLPQTISQPQAQKKGVLGTIEGIDPTMFVGPLQAQMGMKMLKGEKRPVFKGELDPRYNKAVERAQYEAQYGLTPEQRFMAEQDVQKSLNDALAQGRSMSGGSGVQAYNLNRAAANEAWRNKLGLKQADLGARMEKQQYADRMMAERASIIERNRRQAFEDAMMGFQQRQGAGAQLVGAGLANTIGAYRFNKDLQAQRERNNLDWSRNYGTQS